MWPPPLEDLRAFSVIDVGEDRERAASLLIVAGLAAPAHPQPALPAPPPARTAPPSRAASRPAITPAPQRLVARPRTPVRARVAVPAPARNVSWRWALPRWAWLGLAIAAALVVGF